MYRHSIGTNDLLHRKRVTIIANGTIRSWQAYRGARRFEKYGSQKGWESVKELPGHDTEHISTFVSSKKLTDAEWERLKSEAEFTDGDDLSFEVPF